MKALLALAALFVLSGCFEPEPMPEIKANKNELVIISQDGRQHRFDIELALNQQEMAKGLMNRESLPENGGMMFFFGDEEERGFWMRNTLIPLDMIFIKADGTIHRIHENAIPHDENTIYSQGPVQAVLEINGGRAAELGIKAGDTAHHVYFGNTLAP